MNDYSFGARAALLTSLCLSSLKTHHFSGKQGNWALRQQVLEFQENKNKKKMGERNLKFGWMLGCGVRVGREGPVCGGTEDVCSVHVLGEGLRRCRRLWYM